MVDVNDDFLDEEDDFEDEGDINNLDFILDIPLRLTAEFGRTKMLINDLLQLGIGSVIELDKTVDEPLEILVNGKLVARGEVVVMNDRMAIKITDILSPSERVEQLK